VEEFTHSPSRVLAQKGTVEEADAQDDGNSNSRTSTTFSGIWVWAVEIWRR
jgi:hypothetical protein